MYNNRIYHSIAFSICGWPPVDQPSDACTFAFGVPSSVGVLRWNPRMTIVVVVLEHLLLVEAVEAVVVSAIALAGNSCQ